MVLLRPDLLSFRPSHVDASRGHDTAGSALLVSTMLPLHLERFASCGRATSGRFRLLKSMRAELEWNKPTTLRRSGCGADRITRSFYSFVFGQSVDVGEAGIKEMKHLCHWPSVGRRGPVGRLIFAADWTAEQLSVSRSKGAKSGELCKGSLEKSPGTIGKLSYIEMALLTRARTAAIALRAASKAGNEQGGLERLKKRG